jgi:hypothetical protein
MQQCTCRVPIHGDKSVGVETRSRLPLKMIAWINCVAALHRGRFERGAKEAIILIDVAHNGIWIYPNQRYGRINVEPTSTEAHKKYK